MKRWAPIEIRTGRSSYSPELTEAGLGTKVPERPLSTEDDVGMVLKISRGKVEYLGLMMDLLISPRQSGVMMELEEGACLSTHLYIMPELVGAHGLWSIFDTHPSIERRRYVVNSYFEEVSALP